ncbi:hypothetical protein [Polyangium sp. 15x6]|uniref:hypothetical protein n=1 Tax=Polyangium sp. 15x6 TaxID=3042687 RepID=UPI00249A8100|nr:hypothetical protein [Polyangium sp. 15x6]MDI3287354.1 hypothetical protein [Polyangium sp. 15x6]
MDPPRVFDENAPPESSVVPVASRRQPWWARFFATLADAFGSPPLWKRLPPIPPPRSPEATRVSAGAVGHDEHGEYMLFALLRAPSVYQRAAVHVAYRALDARRRGDDAYAEFIVQFTLSRMRPDRDGRISMQRLQDSLCHLGHAGGIAPVLRRLEDQGIVELVLKDSDDPMAAILRLDITHVVLRVRA